MRQFLISLAVVAALVAPCFSQRCYIVDESEINKLSKDMTIIDTVWANEKHEVAQQVKDKMPEIMRRLFIKFLKDNKAEISKIAAELSEKK